MRSGKDPNHSYSLSLSLSRQSVSGVHYILYILRVRWLVVGCFNRLTHLIGCGDASVDRPDVAVVRGAGEVERCAGGAVRVRAAAAAVAAAVIVAAVATPEPRPQVHHLHRQVLVHRAQIRADAAELLGALWMEGTE